MLNDYDSIIKCVCHLSSIYFTFLHVFRHTLNLKDIFQWSLEKKKQISKIPRGLETSFLLARKGLKCGWAMSNFLLHSAGRALPKMRKVKENFCEGRYFPFSSGELIVLIKVIHRLCYHSSQIALSLWRRAHTRKHTSQTGSLFLRASLLVLSHWLMSTLASESESWKIIRDSRTARTSITICLKTTFTLPLHYVLKSQNYHISNSVRLSKSIVFSWIAAVMIKDNCRELRYREVRPNRIQVSPDLILPFALVCVSLEKIKSSVMFS